MYHFPPQFIVDGINPISTEWTLSTAVLRGEGGEVCQEAISGDGCAELLLLSVQL